MSGSDSGHGDPDRWRGLVRRTLPNASDELVDEVADDVAARWQAARGRGLSSDEADRRVGQDLAAWSPMPDDRRRSIRRLTSGWSSEARHAWRLATRRPAFAFGAVTLTGIAVAATVATFAIGYGLFWRALPYPLADRLAVIWQAQQGEMGQVALADFRDLTAAAAFDASTLLAGGDGSLRVTDGIERINLLEVDPSAFALLGARPQLGRLLAPEDSGRATVLISDRLWRKSFGGSPDILGRPLWVSGRTYTVAGVLMPGFDFELPVAGFFVLEHHDMWMVGPAPTADRLRRDFRGFEGLVRLDAATTIAQAQAEVDAIGRRIAQDHPSTNADRTFRIVPLQTAVVGRMKETLLLGGLAALLTLGIALVNLVTLAGVRLSERETELAVRQALGAGAVRVRRQLLTEYALLVAAGTLAGIAIARVIVFRLAANSAAHLPRPDAIRFDLPIVLAAAFVGALFVAALTAIPLRGHRFHEALRRGSRASHGNRRLRRALVGAQFALALALSAGCAVLGLGLLRLHALDPGFATSAASTARVSAYSADYPERDDVVRFYRGVEETLRAVPGVEHVGTASSLPLSGEEANTSVMAEGYPIDPAARPDAGWAVVTPGYFDALGMPLVRGRVFSDADLGYQRHVVVINEALARELFPGEDPIGRRIAVGGGDADDDWHEVVGVVADVRHRALAEAPRPRVYDLLGQHWERTLFVVARAAPGSPPPAAATIRTAVAHVDANAPVFEPATLDDLMARSAAPHQLATAIAAGLAITGLLLALTGVYAMSAVGASERRHEMGVRAALGASPGEVFWLVLRDSTSTVIAGSACGLVAAVAISQLLQARVFGVAGTDLAWLIPVCAVGLTTAGVIASAVPARQAAVADPLASVKAD